VLFWIFVKCAVVLVSLTVSDCCALH